MNQGNYTLRRLVVSAFFLSLPVALQAQVTFQWETRRQDTLYRTVEDCLGFLMRVEGRARDKDTTASWLRPSHLRVEPNTIADSVVTAARRCSDKFSVEALVTQAATDPTLALNAFTLLIKAKRDSDAIAFVDRWTATLPDQDDTLRNVFRHRAAIVVLEDLPTRFATIRQLTESIDLQRFWPQKFELYGKMMERAGALRDSTELEIAVGWLIRTSDNLSDSIKKLGEWGSPGEAGPFGLVKRPPALFVVRAREWVEREALLALLRESSERYLATLDTLKQKEGYRPSTRTPQLAKPIVAGYWFPEPPVNPRPTRGKVAVVVPILDNLCNPCTFGLGEWGRLAKRFPDIEFTGLARTHGHHGKYFGVLPAPDEAQIIDSFHRKVYGFPGMIAIHETQFWRIDETYDRRVIEERGPNEDQYPLFAFISPPRVIDRAGRFVPFVRVALDPEEALALLFEALLNQPSP